MVATRQKKKRVTPSKKRAVRRTIEREPVVPKREPLTPEREPEVPPQEPLTPPPAEDKEPSPEFGSSERIR